MNKNQPTRPLEEGVDTSDEKIVLDRLKTVATDKITAVPCSEGKKRMLSQPVSR